MLYGGIELREYILVINPGSTSTKVAIFCREECIKQKNLYHAPDEIKKYEKVFDQFEFRMKAVLDWLDEENISLSALCAVVGRGGILKPMPGGTYKVTEKMVDDLKYTDREEHASNLGAIIAKGIADRENIPSFIVDPVAVDEFSDVARVSGLPELPRRSMVHALNVKAISRRAAKDLGKDLSDTRFVVAHLGGGITIAPVVGGRIIDANVAIDGGPFSPDRAGSVPVGDLIGMCYSGKYTIKEIKKKVIGHGGLVGYLGTSDCREVEKRIEDGDTKAAKVFEAMAYQISKEIWAMACVLSGHVDAVVLTGGLAYSERLVDYVKSRVKAIAPVLLHPGEDEMLSLAQGTYRVLKGEEKAKIYEDEVFEK